ncbi:MAG: hypothetical protein JXA14_23760 [Anaerolineae bacterium]|nr:hypothetical protein [Anaerolineae bacterium]
MNMRVIILLAIVALLLIGSVALRRTFGKLSLATQGSTLAQSNGPPPAQYIVAQGTASGGSYYLTSQAWRVGGVASSEEYHLVSPASPTGTGTPCCCAYLPCVLSSH